MNGVVHGLDFSKKNTSFITGGVWAPQKCSTHFLKKAKKIGKNSGHIVFFCLYFDEGRSERNDVEKIAFLHELRSSTEYCTFLEKTRENRKKNKTYMLFLELR